MLASNHRDDAGRPWLWLAVALLAGCASGPESGDGNGDGLVRDIVRDTARGSATRPAAVLAERDEASDESEVLTPSQQRGRELARATLERMGGAAAWERARYLTWSFFGHRRHLWDKQRGRIRVEGTLGAGQSYTVLLTLAEGEGRAWVDGREVTVSERKIALLHRAESAWINDSYWVFMPYKLLDPGVTLTHLGEGTSADGAPCDLLRLTFAEVGRTPENAYRVYIGRDSGLICQWDFYSHHFDEEPTLSSPWRGWRQQAGLWLSDDRGERRGEPGRIGDLRLLEEVPSEAFETPTAVDYEKLVRYRRPRWVDDPLAAARARKRAGGDLERIADAVELFLVEHARYPESILELVRPPAGARDYYLRGRPVDPWAGRDYRLEPLTVGFRLSAFGADARPGGVGEDRDLSLERGSRQ